MTVLHHVISVGNVNLLHELLAAGADINSGELYSPLAFAILEHEEFIDILLEAGASINPEDATLTNLTPLNMCLRGDLDRARQFLDMGANIGFLDLAVATNDHTTETLKLLVEYGADLNMTDGIFSSVSANLWFYVDEEFESLPVWKYLIEHNVKLNVIGNQGLTLLMEAVHNDAFEFVQFLIEHGADPTFRLSTDVTALDLTDNERIITLLNEAIIRWNSEHDQ